MRKRASRLDEAIPEMADDQLRSGLMDKATHEGIMIRHSPERAAINAQPISGEEIRMLRERADLSQEALARYLNVTICYISQLELGTKQPKGTALAL